MNKVAGDIGMLPRIFTDEESPRKESSGSHQLLLTSLELPQKLFKFFLTQETLTSLLV